MSSNAISVQNLSKCYHIYDKPHDRLKQFILPRLQRLFGLSPRQYFKKFWALHDVSFEVKKGETVGIIGRNGSGKSTLLQMICGTLNPTSGSIQVNGRVAALLELGSGFNPEFTGRENVYMNASILGLSNAEIDARFNDIVAFADIGDFIEQPVKTYSSGMMVRLAFAVQTQVNPDILIIDEALAVGDAKFQVRCFDRLKQLNKLGTSILLVTHSSEQVVTHCSRAILLNSGHVVEAGVPRHVVNRYMDLLFGKEIKKEHKDTPAVKLAAFNNTNDVAESVPLNMESDVFSTRPGYNPHEYRWGDGAVSILDFCIAADNSLYPSTMKKGQIINLSVSIKFINDLVCPILGITIKTKEGVTVYGVNNETLEIENVRSLGQADTVIQAKAIFTCRFAAGDYFISLGIATRHGDEIIPHDRRYDAIHFQVLPDGKFFGLIDVDMKLAVISIENQ